MAARYTDVKRFIAIAMLFLCLTSCKVISTWDWGAVKYYKTVEGLHADDWGPYGQQWWARRQLHYCNEAGTCWDVPTPGFQDGQEWWVIGWCPDNLAVCNNPAGEAENQL